MMKNQAQRIAEMSIGRTTLSISPKTAYDFNVYKVTNGFKSSDELLVYLLELAKEKGESDAMD